MRGRADRWDYALTGALGVRTMLSRLPYRARMLCNWDGRFLYTLPVDRRPIAYAGDTLVRDR